MNLIHIVANIAALRLATATFASLVHVVGYYSATIASGPDGGGGDFVLDTTDITSADNGGTIIVDGLGRRWKRQFFGLKINVQWFGAVGDGNGSSGVGTDNYTAFQNAITYCLTLAGGFIGGRPGIYIPAGAYRIGNTLTQNGIVNWEGEGKAAGAFDYGSIILFDHANDDCITFDVAYTYTEGWTVRDLVFWGINQSVLQDCFHFIKGDLLSTSGMDNVGFANFTGACLHWPVGSTAYFQATYFNKIFTTVVGAFIRVDPSVVLAGTMLSIREFDQENGINTTIATQHAFFDFRAFREIHCMQTIIEGGALNPSIFTFGTNTYNVVDGLHVEDGPATCIFEFVTGGYPYGTGVSVSTFSNLNILGLSISGSLVKFNAGMVQNQVTVHDASVGVDFANLCDDQGTGNTFDIYKWTQLGAIPLTNNFLSSQYFKNLQLLQAYPVQNVFSLSLAQDVFLLEHGQWLDGISGGPVTISVEGTTITDIGMYTDADVGRVFELVSVADTIPRLDFTITAPSDLVEQQVICLMRYYVDTADPNIIMFPLSPAGVNASSKAVFTGDRSLVVVPDPVLPLNVWHTGYCVLKPPNTTATLVTTVKHPLGPAPVGVMKLRIASVFIATGRGVPPLTSGGLATTAITWKAAAAPTYGVYVVGDRVINKTPVVGQPKAWSCTVAGSPGTWVSEGNL